MIRALIVNVKTKKSACFEFPMRFEELVKIGVVDEGDYEVREYDAPFRLSKKETIEGLNKLAELASEYQNHPAFKYIDEIMKDGIFSDIHEAFEHISDIQIYGECKSWTDFAHYYVNEVGIGSLSGEQLGMYFDYEKFGRDVSLEGNYDQLSDGVIAKIV